jgi:hypothetical protein
MSYTINLTANNAIYTTVLDGTVNQTTGLNLIGRNYTNYGQAQNENFVKLLENFADNQDPRVTSGALLPLKGTLWYDTGNRVLKVLNGVDFVPVSGRTVSSTAPTLSVSVGDQWYDAANQQLKQWSGTAWVVIGPTYSNAQGKTGAFAETLIDVGNANHSVVSEYANGQLVSITSNDTFDLSLPYYGFNTITAGVNSANSAVISENLTVGAVTELGDDTTVSGQLYLNWLHNGTPASGPALLPTTTGIYDIGAPGSQLRDIYLARNLTFGFANIGYAGQSLILQNTTYGGNVDIYINGTSGNIRALHIDGNSGLMSAYSAPTQPNHLVTKAYVDNGGSNISTDLANQYNILNGEITQLRNDYIANLVAIVASTNSNLNTATTTINSNAAALSSLINAEFLATNANIADKTQRIQSLENLIQYKSNIASPEFTGTPTVPDVAALTNYLTSVGGTLAFPGLGDTSTTIADTNYVDATANLLYGDYTNKLNNEITSRTAAIANALLIKSNIASPAFTGTPTAPTAALSDVSSTIATTAYVTGKIAAQQFNYTVSTNPPSGGNPGDFWFQIG